MPAESLLGIITGAGGAVTVLTVWVTVVMAGKLHTDAEMRRADETIERQARALDRAEEANAQLRQALADANARGDAAVQASQLIADAFKSAK